MHAPVGCRWCGGEIPDGVYGNTRFCGDGCAWASQARTIKTHNAQTRGDSAALDLRCALVSESLTKLLRGAYSTAMRADPCAFCGAPATVLARIDTSGATEWTNRTASCSSCSRAKAGESLLSFLATQPQGGDPQWSQTAPPVSIRTN